MKFEEKYKRDALKLGQVKSPDKQGVISWRSPSNIALIKYWGKRQNQLPQNPSLSFVLDKSFTETRLKYHYKGNKSNAASKIDFKFEGKPNSEFGSRVKDFFISLSEFLPFINYFDFKIESSNSFPHSSGIASSASSMSALALCLVSMELELFGTPKDKKSFFQKASFLSRLGSGSASRSVFNGFVIWGKHKSIPDSSDELALRLNHQFSPKFNSLRDAILITSMVKKKVSSSAGHQLMESHPYADIRYKQARDNLVNLLHALKTGDEKMFIRIVENEALSLHAMMMASAEGFTLLNENTWKIINMVRQYRTEHKVFITFTLDAGPNVHLIYMAKQEKQIFQFIQKELLQFCEKGHWIDDKAGLGPIKLN